MADPIVIRAISAGTFFRLSGSPAALQGSSAGRLFDRARTLLESNDISGAKKAFQEMIEEFPCVSSGYAGRGLVNALEGKPEEAEKDFFRALKKDPDDQQAMIGLGDLRLMQGRFDEAGVRFKDCLGVNPRNAAAAIGMAEVSEFQGKGDIDGAVRYYELARSVAPDIAQELNEDLCRLLMKKIEDLVKDKHPTLLKQYLDKVFPFIGMLSDAQKKNLAAAYMKYAVSRATSASNGNNNGNNECVAYAQTALQLSPSYDGIDDVWAVGTLTLRAMDRINSGEFETAEKLLDIAEKLHRNDPQIRSNIVTAYGFLITAYKPYEAMNLSRVEKYRLAIQRLDPK